MSNTESTSVNLSSRLVQGGYKKTPLAIAITELVGTYLGASGKIDGKLLAQLQSTRSEAAEVMSTVPDGESSSITAANDPAYTPEKQAA